MWWAYTRGGAYIRGGLIVGGLRYCGMLAGYQFNQIIHKRMYASISGILNNNMVGICNAGFIRCQQNSTVSLYFQVAVTY